MPSEQSDSRSRRDLKSGEWACVDSRCFQVNSESRTSCKSCGKAKPQAKSKAGKELGKDAADKSKGLFSANDWECSKCGNVNWAKRNSCNVCNAKKYADTEQRTGFGGGFNDRQQVEYIQRSDNDEFDEFGRRKKKSGQEASKSEDGQLDEEESEGDEGSEDLEKYNFDDLDDIKIDLSNLKRKADDTGSVVSSDCSCSCSGNESCSCEEEAEEEVQPKRAKKDTDRSRDHRRSPDRRRYNDRHDSRDRERRRSRDRSRERNRR